MGNYDFGQATLASISSSEEWNHQYPLYLGFLDGASTIELACQHRRLKRCEFNPWVGKISWRRAWQPTLYSCLENLMDRGAWWATVLGITKNQTRLSGWAPTTQLIYSLWPSVWAFRVGRGRGCWADRLGGRTIPKWDTGCPHTGSLSPSLYLLHLDPARGGSGGRTSYPPPRDRPRGSLPSRCQLTEQSFLPQPLVGALPLQQGTGKWLSPYSPLLRLTLTVLLWKKGGFHFFFFFSFPSSALTLLSLGCLSHGPLWSGPGVCGQPFSIGSCWRVSPSGRAVWPYCAWWERGWPLEAPAGPLLYWLLLNWNT